MATRGYHSPTRQAQSSATRRRVVVAAQECFQERGYVGTTMRAIAQRAQVSVETVHQTAAKRDLLLAAFTLTVSGEDGPGRLLDRPEPKAIFDDPDPVRRLRGMAGYVTGINTRVIPLWRAFEQAAAADPQVATEYADLITRMRSELRDALTVLAERGDLREDRPIAELADLLWLLVLPDQYFRLCEQAGWSVERYVAWLAESMLDLLLPSRHGSAS
ncbi:TetR/AcrR family transcriptional regulator [Plantactinospora solaniradicis]|uniref:TetR/AcrR family transcriptional regulator n=1 Tax=Plantactinospora solaniradicis TaxID=1723736 RepID=A0ABW1KMS9_9ACTN